MPSSEVLRVLTTVFNADDKELQAALKRAQASNEATLAAMRKAWSKGLGGAIPAAAKDLKSFEAATKQAKRASDDASRGIQAGMRLTASEVRTATQQFRAGMKAPSEFARELKGAERELETLRAASSGTRQELLAYNQAQVAVNRAQQQYAASTDDAAKAAHHMKNQAYSLRNEVEAGNISDEEAIKQFEALRVAALERANALEAGTKAHRDMTQVAATAARSTKTLSGEVTKLGFSGNTVVGVTHSLTSNLRGFGPAGSAASLGLAAVTKQLGAMNAASLTGIARAQNLTSALAVGLTAALAVAGAALTKFISSSADWATDLRLTAESVNITAEGLQELQYAADVAGKGSATLTSTLERFARRAGEAADGTGSAVSAYEALGISVTDAAGRVKDTGELFREVADEISKLDDATRKTSLAYDIFGRQGIELLPILNLGADGLQRMAAEADALGTIVSNQDLADLHAMGDQLTILGKRFQAVRHNLAADLLPVLQDDLMPFLEGTVMPGIRALGETIGDVATAVTTVTRIFGDNIAALAEYGIKIAAATTATRLMTAAVRTLGITAGIAAPPLLAIQAAVVAVTIGVTAWTRRTREAREAQEALEKTIATLPTASRDALNAITDLTTAVGADGLEGAMLRLAATLEVEARDEFVNLARQAIASGGDIEDVADSILQILARIKAESLDTQVAAAQRLLREAERAVSMAEHQERGNNMIRDLLTEEQKKLADREAALATALARPTPNARQVETLQNLIAESQQEIAKLNAEIAAGGGAISEAYEAAADAAANLATLEEERAAWAAAAEGDTERLTAHLREQGATVIDTSDAVAGLTTAYEANTASLDGLAEAISHYEKIRNAAEDPDEAARAQARINQLEEQREALKRLIGMTGESGTTSSAAAAGVDTLTAAYGSLAYAQAEAAQLQALVNNTAQDADGYEELVAQLAAAEARVNDMQTALNDLKDPLTNARVWVGRLAAELALGLKEPTEVFNLLAPTVERVEGELRDLAAAGIVTGTRVETLTGQLAILQSLLDAIDAPAITAAGSAEWILQETSEIMRLADAHTKLHGVTRTTRDEVAAVVEALEWQEQQLDEQTEEWYATVDALVAARAALARMDEELGATNDTLGGLLTTLRADAAAAATAFFGGIEEAAKGAAATLNDTADALTAQRRAAQYLGEPFGEAEEHAKLLEREIRTLTSRYDELNWVERLRLEIAAQQLRNLREQIAEAEKLAAAAQAATAQPDEGAGSTTAEIVAGQQSIADLAMTLAALDGATSDTRTTLELVIRNLETMRDRTTEGTEEWKLIADAILKARANLAAINDELGDTTNAMGAFTAAAQHLTSGISSTLAAAVTGGAFGSLSTTINEITRSMETGRVTAEMTGRTWNEQQELADRLTAVVTTLAGNYHNLTDAQKATLEIASARLLALQQEIAAAKAAGDEEEAYRLAVEANQAAAEEATRRNAAAHQELLASINAVGVSFTPLEEALNRATEDLMAGRISLEEYRAALDAIDAAQERLADSELSEWLTAIDAIGRAAPTELERLEAALDDLTAAGADTTEAFKGLEAARARVKTNELNDQLNEVTSTLRTLAGDAPSAFDTLRGTLEAARETLEEMGDDTERVIELLDLLGQIEGAAKADEAAKELAGTLGQVSSALHQIGSAAGGELGEAISGLGDMVGIAQKFASGDVAGAVVDVVSEIVSAISSLLNANAEWRASIEELSSRYRLLSEDTLEAIAHARPEPIKLWFITIGTKQVLDEAATDAAAQYANTFAGAMDSALRSADFTVDFNLGIDRIIQEELILGFLHTQAVQDAIVAFTKAMEAGNYDLARSIYGTLEEAGENFWEALRAEFPELYATLSGAADEAAALAAALQTTADNTAKLTRETRALEVDRAFQQGTISLDEYRAALNQAAIAEAHLAREQAQRALQERRDEALKGLEGEERESAAESFQLEADAIDRRFNESVTEAERGATDAIKSILALTTSGLTDNLRSAFDVSTYAEFTEAFGASMRDTIRGALITGFLESTAMKPMLEELGNLISDAILTGTFDAATKAAIGEQVDAITTGSEEFFKWLQEIGYGFKTLNQATESATEALTEMRSGLLNVPNIWKETTRRWDVAPPAATQGGSTRTAEYHFDFTGANVYGINDLESLIVNTIKDADETARLTGTGV